MVSRQLVSWLLSGVIVLQSLAAVALPCAMPMGGGDDSHPAMDMAHHAGHAMASASGDESHRDTVGGQCCDGGYCSQSGCVAVAVVVSATVNASIPRGIELSLPAKSGFPIWSPESPFRPPSA